MGSTNGKRENDDGRSKATKRTGAVITSTKSTTCGQANQCCNCRLAVRMSFEEKNAQCWGGLKCSLQHATRTQRQAVTLLDHSQRMQAPTSLSHWFLEHSLTISLVFCTGTL